MAEKKANNTERLITLIEEGHVVIKANAESNVRLTDAISQLNNVVSLLVTQVTTSISQKNEAVPMKVFLMITGVLVLIIAAVVGLDISGYHIGDTP